MKKLFPLIFCILLISKVQAQYGLSNAKNLAMGFACSPFARGAESAFFNPAHLAKQEKNIEILVLGVGAIIRNNSFTLQQYNQYSGTYLNDNDKQDILASISDNAKSESQIEAQVLAICYKSVTFSTSLNGGLFGDLSKDLFDISLFGNRQDQNYSFNPGNGELSSFIKTGISYGISLPWKNDFISHVSSGISLKYLYGHYYYKVLASKINTLTTFNQTYANGSVEMQKAKGGSGYAIDLGFAAETVTGWRFSLNAFNLFNNMKWNSDCEKLFYDFTLQDDDIDTWLAGDADFDSTFVTSDTSISIPSFNTRLPVILRFGTGYTIGKMNLAAEWIQSFKESAYSNKQPVIALGGEFSASNIFKIRAGLNYTGPFGMNYSTGLGVDLNSISWNIAIATTNGITPESAKGLALATHITMVF